ncbi:hypothetical protein [Novosphingobium aquimarinum]|uniref:hypothetical protein n=1 Tax=Novosphingobium aquimarinum TaxID=2682494 RepID=UPI0012EB9076|nr:hypothetical protein [Novosphingobium aquimarinum]
MDASKSKRWTGMGSVVALFAIHALGFVLVRSGAFNHDLAFVVVGGQKLLVGGQFGVDVTDPNPPLAWWLATAFLAIGNALRLAPQTSATVFTLALSFGACLFIARAAGTRHAIAAAIVLLALPGYDFGQREHWLAILALPWLLAAADWRDRRKLGRGMRTVAVASGAIGFCLKPYFVLIPIAVECWFLVRRRSLADALRPGNFGLLAIGVLYGLSVWALAPEYYTRVLPDTLAIYWAFDVSFAEILRIHALPSLLIVAGGAMLLRATTSVPPRAQALAAATLGALLAAVLQFKGWQYHFLPERAFAVIGAIWLIIDAAGLPGRAVFRFVALAPILFAALAPTVQRRGESAGALRDERALAATIRQWSRPGEGVFGFITTPRAVLPAVLRTDRRWRSGACCVQFVPALVRGDERGPSGAGRTRAVATRKLDDLIANLAHDPPRILLVDDRDFKLGFDAKPFDYAPWLRSDPRLRRLFAAYRERPGVAGFRVFVRQR